MRHRLIRTVDRQGVLDQVVGSNGQEVEILQEHMEREGRGRDLDHGDDLDRTVDNTSVVKLNPRMVNQCQRLANFAGVNQPGNQQIGLAVSRCPQNGAQLLQEHGRIGQAPTNGAQSQRRVQVRRVLK